MFLLALPGQTGELARPWTPDQIDQVVKNLKYEGTYPKKFEELIQGLSSIIASY